MGEKVLRILFAITIGVWVTRYLGPEEFGILNYAQSFVGLFAAFSSLGLNDILIRELIKYPESENKLMGTSFLLQTLGSGLIMLILIISIILNDNEAITNKIIILLGLMTFLQSAGIISSYFFSKIEGRLVVMPNLISLLLSSVLKVYLILNNYSLIYFVYLLIFDVLIISLFNVYFYKRLGKSIFQWRFSFSLAKSLLKDSWSLVLSTIVVSIYMKIDQVMIKEISGNVSVGQYAAAVQLSSAWYFIPVITCASIFPAIINAKEKDKKLYHDRLKNLFDLMVVMGFSVIIPVTLLSDWIVDFLYGDDFALTASVLSIHIWAGVFVFLGVANQKWFINENLQAYNIICLGMGLVANILLNFLWIPKYGIVGAAYATLISQFVASVLSPVIFKKTRPSFWWMMESLMFISLFRKIFQNNEHNIE